MSEHVILVAFTVEGPSREVAERRLHNYLPKPSTGVDPNPVVEWWVAEDERYDRSDNESAVFVPLGMSAEGARRVLEWANRRPDGVEINYALGGPDE